jgi:hypothetical protein
LYKTLQDLVAEFLFSGLVYIIFQTNHPALLSSPSLAANPKAHDRGRARWLKPVFLATQEAEIGKITVSGQP